MSSGHNEPKLLYAIPSIQAYHIEHGRETSLTPAGPQTLSLLMVPTSSPFADLSTIDPSSAAPEEDFYLHLHLPPELDLPLPATTQIYHQPPRSYLIPRWDLGRDSGAFTRIEFPSLGDSKVTQDDVDTFETILAQCTAFLERVAPPDTKQPWPKDKKVMEELPPYNPGDFAPGEGYVHGSSSHSGGQIVLVDEEDGSVVGELSEGFHVVEDKKLQSGSKDPVEITLPQDGTGNITVAPVSPEYLEMAMHPAFKKSSLVSSAASASRLIVTTSGHLSNMMLSGADSFQNKTKPGTKPMTFDQTTHMRVRKAHTFTNNVAGMSSKTVGQLSHYAQNFGASLAGRSSKKGSKGFDADGNMIENYKPSLLNKSIMAFSTIADGIDQAGRNLLTSGSSATTTMVTHRWGPEAGEISKSVTGGFTNVGLVYIDATGVSRRAILKSVAKGMVVGRVKGGGEVVVGGGDGGSAVTPPAASQQNLVDGRATPDSTYLARSKSPSVVGFGMAASSSQATGVGETLDNQPAYAARR